MPVVYDTESAHAAPGELGPYREADYLELPDQPRCELLYGRLPVTPAPSLRHQDVVGSVYRLLFELATKTGGRAFVAPVDVVLAEHSIVQPDVVYVAPGRSEILGRRVEGAPDLVVEVLSAATARRDAGDKIRLYAEFGIAEYWIVDPELETFEFLEKGPNGFRVRVPEAGIYHSAAIPGLELDLEAFWRALPS
jgi:Uma2 family endonuclease